MCHTCEMVVEVKQQHWENNRTLVSLIPYNLHKLLLFLYSE